MVYKIVRYFEDSESKTIKTGLTLEQAKAHCKRDDTEGVIKRRGGKCVRWFDGFVKQGAKDESKLKVV